MRFVLLVYIKNITGSSLQQPVANRGQDKGWAFVALVNFFVAQCAVLTSMVSIKCILHKWYSRSASVHNVAWAACVWGVCTYFFLATPQQYLASLDVLGGGAFSTHAVPIFLRLPANGSLQPLINTNPPPSYVRSAPYGGGLASMHHPRRLSPWCNPCIRNTDAGIDMPAIFYPFQCWWNIKDIIVQLYSSIVAPVYNEGTQFAIF